LSSDFVRAIVQGCDQIYRPHQRHITSRLGVAFRANLNAGQS
jgi:hypothetical protein